VQSSVIKAGDVKDASLKASPSLHGIVKLTKETVSQSGKDKQNVHRTRML
jgi:hypothetical protein